MKKCFGRPCELENAADVSLSSVIINCKKLTNTIIV